MALSLFSLRCAQDITTASLQLEPAFDLTWFFDQTPSEKRFGKAAGHVQKEIRHGADYGTASSHRK